MKIKFLFLIIPLLLSIVGCDNHKEEKASLQARIDSLELVNKQAQENLADMQSYVSVIADGLDSIAYQEDVLLSNNKGREGVVLDREQLKRNLEAFEEILQQQKIRIGQLADSLKKRGESMERLSALVEHLNKQLEEKDATIKQLQADLNKKNVDIRKLNLRVQSLSDDNNKLSNKIEQQKEALTVQTKIINEGFVFIGTKQELKEKGIITGGFLKKTKVNTNGINKEVFTCIDISKYTEVKIESGIVKILSQMPANSYHIVKEDKNNSILYITDPTSFWSLSNYLIIQTN